MSELNARLELLLEELQPEGLSADSPFWQQRKSSEMRTAIMEATVHCLAEYGYPRTTIQLIAKHARASRGATLHHYATKQDLIAAVIDYAFYKRMEWYHQRIRQLTEEERTIENAGLEIAWASHFRPEYKAFLELSMAALTDAELRDIFLPKAKRYDAIWREQLMVVFPEWAVDPAQLKVASEFARATIDGLYLNREIWADSQTEQRVLRIISQTMLAIRQGKIDTAL